MSMVTLMERRRFGSTNQDVSAIGQGTWLIDDGDRALAVAAFASARCAASAPTGWTSTFCAGGASTRSNAGAGSLRLTDAEVARIDEACPRGHRPRELPML